MFNWTLGGRMAVEFESRYNNFRWSNVDCKMVAILSPLGGLGNLHDNKPLTDPTLQVYR